MVTTISTIRPISEEAQGLSWIKFIFCSHSFDEILKPSTYPTVHAPLKPMYLILIRELSTLCPMAFYSS